MLRSPFALVATALVALALAAPTVALAGPKKVPVVTTSTFRAAPSSPLRSTTSIISSAVTTTAFPCRIFSLIS